MPYMPPEEIHAVLESGEFGPLIGLLEDERVDAKSQPYAVQTFHGKLELAKDASSLAARGGILVIGLRTEPSEAHQADQVVAIREVPENLIDRQRYLDIIRAWVYPVLENVSVAFHPSLERPDRGLVSINIPKQDDDRAPFLMVYIEDPERGRAKEIVFGLAERVSATVQPLDLRDLHGLVRDGRRFGQLSERLDRALERMAESRADAAPGPPALLEQRITAALNAGGLSESPVVIFVTVPRRDAAVRRLFGGPGSPVHELLHHPPVLRRGSFHLSGPEPRIVDGRLRSAGDGIVLELWEDGTLIAVGNAVGFLCWGRRLDEGLLRVNPLQACEVTYLFCELARHVLEFFTLPSTLTHQLRVRRMSARGRRALLAPGDLHGPGMQWGVGLQEAAGEETNIVAQSEPHAHNSGALAYALLTRFYAWFGLSEQDIPYVSVENGERVIDPQQIIADARP